MTFLGKAGRTIFMENKNKPTIYKDEHIVAAWAEPASGPGWSNTPVWVLIRDSSTGKYRVDALQPHEQTGRMSDILYKVSSIAHTDMVEEAKKCYKKGPI